jgi:hypothetical protein
MRRFKLISLILIPLTLSGCAGSQVVSTDNGKLVVKGPRVAWGPEHETYTTEAQKMADQRCAELGRVRATYIGGKENCLMETTIIFLVPCRRKKF